MGLEIIKRWRDLRRALAVMRPWRGRLLLLGLLGLPLAGVGLGLVWGVGHTLDAFQNGSGDGLLGAVLILAGAFILRAALGSLGNLLTTVLNSRIELELTQKSFGHLLGLPLLTARSGAYAASSLFFDCRNFINTAGGVYRGFILEGLKATALWGYLIHLDWKVGLIIGLAAPAAALPFLWLTRRLGRQAARFYDSTADYWSRAVEAAGAPRLVRAYGGRELELRRFSRTGAERRRRLLRQTALQTALGPLGELLTALALGAAVWAGLDAAALTSLSLGQLGSAAVALGWLLVTLKSLYASLGPLESLIVVHRRLDNLWSEPVEALDGPAPPRDWTRLKLTGLAFAYPDGERVFDGLNLEFAAGRGYHLYGPSGVGKTTLARLLCRLYDPDAGTIAVDGRDAAGFGRGAWRAQALLVDQEPEFLPGGALEAVFYPGDGDAAQRGEARRLLELVGLSPLIGARGLSLGGSELSGGQRRRLALARALFRRPRLLILDETTSFVDAAAERELLTRVRAELPEALLIVISHRERVGALVDRGVQLRRGAAPLIN